MNGRFPIQAIDAYTGNAVAIPWEHAEEAYKEYSLQYGTSQSLQRLAERGGFGASEIVMFLCGTMQAPRRWKDG